MTSEAVITLKLSPLDFDLIRTALQDFVDQQRDMIEDPAVKATDKAHAQQDVLHAELLLDRFGIARQRT